jgi:hypothetical protein
MTENDRPLPTPPRARFGRDAREADGPEPPLTSDRMAQAAAEGRLEEFLQRELPESGHARSLALMMMSMSGLMPAGTMAGPAPATGPPAPDRSSLDAQTAASQQIPPEVLAAVQQGNVAELAGLLRAEHGKRFAPAGAESEAPVPGPPAVPAATGRPGIDAAIIDELMRIGADNDVTVDWLVLRAVKLYVEEHRRTGRL